MNISISAAQPIYMPPISNKPLTPKDPKLSTFPNPSGNFSVGGFNAHDTVARVMKSETRSVRLCTASADNAIFILVRSNVSR
jgi:hypothetical protein